MPKILFNGVYDASNRDIFQQGEDERIYRHNAISLFWKYYDGEHRRFLRPTPDTFDDNVVINLCSQAVDRFTSFLFPELPRLKYQDDKLNTEIQRLWYDEEYIPTFLTDIGISGLISGHVYTRLDNSEEGIVRFVNLDPRTITVFWDMRDSKTPLWYRMTWVNSDNVTGQDTYYIEDYVPAKYVPGEDNDGWLIITYEWQPNRQQWLQEIDREVWPYPFAPIVDWKAQPKPFSYYGPSLLKHFHVNDLVNFLWSNTNRILKFHAHPKTIISGAGSQDLQTTAVDEVWAIPVSGATVYNLEMQSDLRASMEMASQARSAFFAQTHVVDTTTQRDKIGQITNFGLHVLFSDMLDHTRLVQQLYGKGIQELMVRAMAMLGDIENVNDKPAIEWSDPLPINRTELVNAAKVEQSVGYTSAQALTETLGRDFDQEQGRIGSEREVDIVVNLGEEGYHNISELPIGSQEMEESDSDSSTDENQWDDNDRLQRSIDSV